MIQRNCSIKVKTHLNSLKQYLEQWIIKKLEKEKKHSSNTNVYLYVVDMYIALTDYVNYETLK